MVKEKKPDKPRQLIEKLGAILGAIAAVGLLVLYLFFTKEETGRGGSLYPFLILFVICAVLSAILSAIPYLYKKEGVQKPPSGS